MQNLLLHARAIKLAFVYPPIWLINSIGVSQRTPGIIADAVGGVMTELLICHGRWNTDKITSSRPPPRGKIFQRLYP